MSAEITLLTMVFGFFAMVVFAGLKDNHRRVECANNIDFCKSYSQCSSFHPREVTKDPNDLFKCGAHIYRYTPS